MRGGLILVRLGGGLRGRIWRLRVHRVGRLVRGPGGGLGALRRLRGRLLLGVRIRLGGGLANDRSALCLGRGREDGRAGVLDGRGGRVGRVPRLLLLQEPQRRHVSGRRDAWLRWPRPGRAGCCPSRRGRRRGAEWRAGLGRRRRL